VNTWRESLARWTAYVRWLGLKRVLRALEEFGAPRRLDESLPQLRQPGPRERIASMEETEALYSKATPAMQCFLHLLNDCGLRWSEALRAAPKHFSAQSMTLSLEVKGGHQHTVPVPEALAELLSLADPERREAPFVEQLAGREGFSRGGIRYQWEKLIAAAGVQPDLRPHDLRRTIAVALYERSKDLRAVQELLGHRNMRSTLHYLAHRDPTKLRSLMLEVWTPKGAKPQ
jgi:integrase